MTSTTWLTERLRPMVAGLFVADEHEPVLDVVSCSVVFLTRDTVHRLLQEETWHHTAWDVARIWLYSLGAPPLLTAASGLLGLNEGPRCLVSLLYFRELEEDPFADWVVHEVAHFFHNNKRRYVALLPRGRCEWMLDVEFRKRELFAHACEIYSRIVASGGDRRGRRALVERLAPRADGFREQLDPAELVDVLREAADARNGWKGILARCRPSVSTG